MSDNPYPGCGPVACKGIRTYGDLLEVLKTFTPEQLALPCQVVEHQPDDSAVHEGKPAVCIGSVDTLGLRYVRSCHDNRRHGDEIFLMVDGNHFAEDGAVAYEWDMDDDEDDKPIYPRGYTPDQNWTGPAQEIADREPGRHSEGGHLGYILASRVDAIHDKGPNADSEE